MATYRRTLNRKLKDSDAIIEQRLKRSRQQRVSKMHQSMCSTAYIFLKYPDLCTSSSHGDYVTY